MNERLAVVTGATRGLGLVTVNEFLKSGWRVVGTGLGERPAGFPAGLSMRPSTLATLTHVQRFGGVYMRINKTYRYAW